VFEHVRTNLQAQIVTAQTGVQQALAAQNTAAQAVDQQTRLIAPLQQAVLQAQSTLQQASANRDAAQATVDQCQQNRDAAQAARDQAAAAITAHLDDEPDETTGTGKPNPAYGAWVQEQKQLQTALNQAQAALNTSNSALVSAQHNRDAASNGVATATHGVVNAQHQVDLANADLGVKQRAYAAAQAAVGAAQQVVANLNAQGSALDARAARLLATPLNRADLEQAADAELDDLLARLGRRHDLLVARDNLYSDRVATLTVQDTTVDAADALRREIGGWSEMTRYPSLGSTTTSLNSAVTDSRAQRVRPPRQRADDLAVATSQLGAALAALLTAVQQATAECDTAAAALTQAAQDLANHEQAQP
jgi:hypothetical protein